MSDTNSKGSKKDTNEIEFAEKSGPTHMPFDSKEGPTKHREPVFTLDENDSGITTELQVERVEPQLQEQLGQLKTQIESISNRASIEKPISDQVELLRKYITLKETEVRDIKEQQKQYQSFTKKLSSQLEKLSTRNREAISELETIKRREEALKKELEQTK